MILAVEDGISEAVCRRLLSVSRPECDVRAVVGLRGYGPLRQRLPELNRSARALEVLLLTDLDTTYPCPGALIDDWREGLTFNSRLLFRVAVHEVESWLLADRHSFAAGLRVPVERLPLEPDLVPDPKRLVVNLARGSRSPTIRADLVPAPGATSAVGPAYNPRMIDFVLNIWNPLQAAAHSPSLRRALERLRAAA